ncbi:MAG: tricarballylate utilization 4Fe-4S protein TcuB [Nostocoides sp.]
MPLDDLFAESQRQLNICNSCRYCAGYCPVWPALELRTELATKDVIHLANLCHDCQDCFTACMYAPPHVFAINPPALFAALREVTYADYVWMPRPLRSRAGRVLTIVMLVLACLLLAALTVTTGDRELMSTAGVHSPYEAIPHTLLIIVMAIPFLTTSMVMLRAAWLYWRDIGGSAQGLLDIRAWGRTLFLSATLRHQTGGAEGCSYPDGEPSVTRKGSHQFVAYGFLLTAVSTVSAWLLQTFLDSYPPYPLLSVPVLTGTVGGVMASFGCVVLLILKRRGSLSETTPQMRRADVALLWALLVVMVTGLLVLALRASSWFAPVLVVHLGAVMASFTVAPYTKFFHWVYRVLSIQFNVIEEGTRQELSSTR